MTEHAASIRQEADVPSFGCFDDRVDLRNRHARLDVRRESSKLTPTNDLAVVRARASVARSQRDLGNGRQTLYTQGRAPFGWKRLAVTELTEFVFTQAPH